MVQPKTSYARNGDVNIAYQVIGDGPLDLLFIPPFVSHLDLYWQRPRPPRSSAALHRSRV
jgi:hypothetical protein